MTETLPGLGFSFDRFKSSDLPGLLELSAQHYLHITQQSGPSGEFFLCPDGEKIKVDRDCVLCVPLYCDKDSLKMLLLVNPKKKDSVVAVYLNDKWWSVEDILQSCIPAQEGLKQVQTWRERIILFVLNCLVCGFLEGSGSENGVCFLPHSTGEMAKILWHHGEALAFYTYKKKGSLCDETGHCYMLPVLDTIYVRRIWQKKGFGMIMLQDFCQTFSQEVALGISSPISAKMYGVCGRFLDDHPKERDRLWEVDPPGDWYQRSNIWLRIQLGETPVELEKSPYCTEKESYIFEGEIKHLTDQGKSLDKKRRRNEEQMKTRAGEKKQRME